jgi:hypothetical protein
MALAPRPAAYVAMRRAILDGQTNLTPEVTDGITSGPGNQGSGNTGLIGQAGTAGVQLSLPRSQHFGTGGTAQGGLAP